MSHQSAASLFQGSKVLCPHCQEYVEMIQVCHAAEVAHVTRRTIYNYIEAGDIFALKVAGKTYRVCSKCLLQPCTDRAANDFKARK